MPVRSHKIEFPGSLGAMLAARLDLPAGGPRAYALFAHCFTCTRNARAAVYIAEALCQEGIAVLRFDFTGLGDSGGEFADTHFSSNVRDLLDAADYLKREHHGPDTIVGRDQKHVDPRLAGLG